MYNSESDVIADLSKKSGVKYSDEQLKILKHKGGMCILACAGSGKTSILTHLLAKRILNNEIKDPSKILCATYSKGGSLELSDRANALLKLMGISATIQVKTLHASYRMVLDHFNLPVETVSGLQRSKFIMEACRDEKIQLGDDDLQLIDSLLSYQVNNLMTDQDMLQSYVYTLENVSLTQYTAIRNGYSARKQASGLIDFDDMQLYMYVLLVQQKRQDVLDFCHSKWQEFYIDEAQDTSRIQFEILKALMVDTSKLVFIGDDDQAIYQWRGADPRIILDICGYLDIQQFILSTNYRCAGNIVRLAAVGIKNNEKRADKTMIPYKEGGEIKICDCGSTDLYDMTVQPYSYIKELIAQGVSLSHIVVLCRNNRQLCILNSMLFKDGIFCDTTDEMRMTKTSIYKDIVATMAVADDTFDKGLVASTLWRIVSYLGVKSSGQIAQFMYDTGLSLSNALGYILTNFGRGGSQTVEWSKSVRIPMQVHDKMELQYNSISGETEQGLVYLYNIMKEPNDVKRVTHMFKLYMIASKFMYKSRDKSRTLTGLVHYFSILIANEGIGQLKQFLRLSEHYETGKLESVGSKLTMSTMHSAKGKEWKHVIIFADDNVTFPSFDGITDMIAKKNNMSDISGSLDENRRLHYVAMTRAKEKLAIFTDKNDVGVFTLEALGVIDKAHQGGNGNIIGMASFGLMPDIIERAQRAIFTPESVYYMKPYGEEQEGD